MVMTPEERIEAAAREMRNAFWAIPEPEAVERFLKAIRDYIDGAVADAYTNRTGSGERE